MQLKKLHFTLILALILIPSVFALPLTALIFQESAKLAKKVAAWNEQCGDKPYYDENCLKKRRALSGNLGQFVSLVNDELITLGDVSPNASDEFVKESNGRRKIMELEVRNALQFLNVSAWLPNLSVPPNRRLSMRRKPPFKPSINRRMPCLTEIGFLSASLSHLPPKNRNRLSKIALWS
jgi:hypothetical protein